MTVSGFVADQTAALQVQYPDARFDPMADGTVLVTIPEVPLPKGWSEATTEVSFVIPNGYPVAKPDCFWASAPLRLAGGAMPMNSAINEIPGIPGQRLWFSWHVATWNPATDGLLTFVRVIQLRFERRN